MCIILKTQIIGISKIHLENIRYNIIFVNFQTIIVNIYNYVIYDVCLQNFVIKFSLYHLLNKVYIMPVTQKTDGQ